MSSHIEMYLMKCLQLLKCLLVLMHLIDFGFNVRNNFDSVQYNTRNSSVLLAYEAQPCPKAVVCLAGETIVKVACGTNHTGFFFISSNHTGFE